MPEPEQEPHRSHSSNHTDSEIEASPAATEPAEEEKEKKNVESKENLEKTEHVEKVEKKGNPHKPRHIGVPMMGMDLMAEMKARQERMAGKKVGLKFGCIISQNIRHECSWGGQNNRNRPVPYYC